MVTTRKATRKLARKQVVIGGATGGKPGDRKVISDPQERERVNPPLSSWAAEEIERLEAASSKTRQRLGHIRMN